MFGPDPLAANLEAWLAAARPGLPNIGPVADPLSSGWLATTRPTDTTWRVEVGMVVDCVAGAHIYRVQFGVNSYRWCTPGGDSGFGTSGARPIATIRLSSTVICVWHPQSPEYGYIISTAAQWAIHRGGQPADAIWPFFRSGHSADTAHSLPIANGASIGAGTPKAPPGIDIYDFAAGRPLDSTSAGEGGYIHETGVGVMWDSFHAQIRADEMTGLWVFYNNQKLRTSGYNREDWSILDEIEKGDGGGELFGVRRLVTYAHEAHGLSAPNQVTPLLEESDNAGGQGDRAVASVDVQGGSGDAVREPESYTQEPAARGYEFEGYLGQGGKKITALQVQLGEDQSWTDFGTPAIDPTTGNINPDTVEDGQIQPPADRNTAGNVQPGVLEEHRTLTGGLHWRSAKRIVFSKRVNVPTPRRARRPGDVGGDSAASGYDPSGLKGTHKVKDEVVPADGSPERGLSIADTLAYIFNWEGLHPFVYHKADWVVPDEGTGGLPQNQVTPDYTVLQTAQYLDDPIPIQLDVDHRYALSNYYETEAVFAMLDDGTVIVYDGWGSMIQMNNGDVTVTAAGDINLRAGKNIQLWAGQDVVVRSRNSVDITATNGDIRAACGTNMQLVAGNLGCGGILLESKAVYPAYDFSEPGQSAITSGITLIAPKSAVYVLSPDVSIQTPDERPDGRVVIDTGISGIFRTQSQLNQNQITSGGLRADQFLDDDGACTAVNEFAAMYTMVGTDLLVAGSITATSDIATTGWVVGPSGVAGPAQTTIPNGADLSAKVTAITAQQTASVTACCGVSATVAPPNAIDAEFTMRTDEDYLTDDGYAIYEARWQMLARKDEQDLPVWNEPYVVGRTSGDQGLPFPGAAWLSTDTYRTYDPVLVDTDSGWVAIPRLAGSTPDPKYTAPVIAAASRSVPNTSYKVIVPLD